MLFIIHLSHMCGESLGMPCSCIQFIKTLIFYCKSQVTRESVSILQVTCAASECAMKSKVRMSTKLYQNKYYLFVAIGIVTHAMHS